MPTVHHLAHLHQARRFSSTLASVCAGVLAVIGIYAVTASHAATNELYFQPSTGSVQTGQTITVQVYANSGTTPTNVVEADVVYNPAQLQYVSFSDGGSAYPLDAGPNPTSNSGSLDFVRASFTNGNATTVTGTALVVTVTFKAVVSSGSAALTFASNSAVRSASNGQNIGGSTGSATYTLTAVPTPTPTPLPPTPTPTPVKTATPAKTPTPTPAKTVTLTPTPVVSVASPIPTAKPSPTATPSGVVIVGPNTTPTPSVIPTVLALGANHNITLPVSGTSAPVSVTGTVHLLTTALDNATKITFEVDGHDAKSGTIDTTYLANGTHIVTTTYTASNGTKQTVTLPLSVSNKLTSWQQARNTVVAAFGGHKAVALSTIVILGLLLVAALAFLVILPHLQAASMQRRLWSNAAAPTDFSANLVPPATAAPVAPPSATSPTPSVYPPDSPLPPAV